MKGPADSLRMEGLCYTSSVDSAGYDGHDNAAAAAAEVSQCISCDRKAFGSDAFSASVVLFAPSPLSLPHVLQSLCLFLSWKLGQE